MMFFYSSLALAAYFWLLIYFTHGMRLFNYDWVQLVFWWILGAGLLLTVTAIGRCGFCKWLTYPPARQMFCGQNRCPQAQ